MLMSDEIKAAIEGLLFVSGDQVGSRELSEALNISETELHQIIQEMMWEYEQPGRGIQILTVDGGYILATKPELTPIINSMIKPPSRHFSPAAMETMAIIAYRQPITKPEIEQLRGVRSDRIIANLLEKGIIKEAGKKAAPGKPALYSTTHEFLRLFNLSSLEELPDLEDHG
jgi:segregation and condensation protein B